VKIKELQEIATPFVLLLWSHALHLPKQYVPCQLIMHII